MKIGTITYEKYEENVLINQHFNVAELFKIILTEEDFVKFEIFDEKKNLLMSTVYKDLIDGKGLISPVKVIKEVEILSTHYNAYATPSTTYRTKVHWKVNGGLCKTKKEANIYAEKINLKQSKAIESLITNH